jgi:hypothetical protein
MNVRQWKFVLVVGLAAAATPVLGQTTIPSGKATQSSIPDFSGIWWHQSLPGMEPPASGQGPVTNLMRRKDNGQSDYNQLVGNYTNPVLKPHAVEVVKKYGDVALSGQVAPSPANQCWPEPLPFIYKNFAIQLLQQSHQVTILYEQDHEVRHVRMNQQHPTRLPPSWYGDSIGHYEADTLVIDTVARGPTASTPWWTCSAHPLPISCMWWSAIG